MEQEKAQLCMESQKCWNNWGLVEQLTQLEGERRMEQEEDKGRQGGGVAHGVKVQLGFAFMGWKPGWWRAVGQEQRRGWEGRHWQGVVTDPVVTVKKWTEIYLNLGVFLATHPGSHGELESCWMGSCGTQPVSGFWVFSGVTPQNREWMGLTRSPRHLFLVKTFRKDHQTVQSFHWEADSMSILGEFQHLTEQHPQQPGLTLQLTLLGVGV